MFRIGLDVHGVIDTHPEIFSMLSKCFIDLGHEVHIITGPSITPEFIEKLKNFGMVWTKLHSITDYNTLNGANIQYQDKDNPWMDDDTWNSTKAKICLENEIHTHIDDSDTYGYWFKKLEVKTKYIQIKND
jgi:hypothetical protein